MEDHCVLRVPFAESRHRKGIRWSLANAVTTEEEEEEVVVVA